MTEIDPNNQPATAEEVVLDNYSTEKRTKDGLHRIRIHHSEYLEAIPQPPTAEEIAAAKREERIGLAVAGGLVTAFFGFIGWIAWLDGRTQRENEAARQERLRSLQGEDTSSSE